MKNKDSKKIMNEGEGAVSIGGANGSVASACGGECNAPMQDCPTIDNVAIDTEKVLGKCDHKHNGYMGKKCFHMPKKVMPTLHRWELCNGGSKRKKDKHGKDKKYAYEKGMKVITSYQDLVEAIDDTLPKPVFVFNIQHDRISSICDQTDNDNERFNKEQFMKNASNDNIEFVGLFTRDEKKCYALAAIEYNVAGQDDCYVNEIQSFKKGFGKILLKRILESQEKVWLLSNPECGEKLLNFYRDPVFKLNEFILSDTIWNGAEAHFFVANDVDEDKFNDFIMLNYQNKKPSSMKSSLEETDEDYFDSMMHDMNKASDSNTDISLDNVYDASEFDQIEANQIVPADSVFFSYDVDKPKQKYIYDVVVTSSNKDTAFNDDIRIESEHLLNFNEIIDRSWPRIKQSFNLTGNFSQTTAEYLEKLEAAKRQLRIEKSVDKFRELAEIPYPVFKIFYGNTSRDFIEIIPNKEDFDAMTEKGIPVAKFASMKDEDPNLEFNEFAAKKLYFNQIIGESKNKITRNPKIIVQKKQSLKTDTVKKAAKIQKITLMKADTTPVEVNQSIKHIKNTTKSLQDALRCIQSKTAKKHFKREKQIKDFKKSKLTAKTISFPRDEVKKLKTQKIIVTTRVLDDYDKFQLGDIVKAPSLGDRQLKVIARCNIANVHEHPMFDELTDKQVEFLSKFDKIAVLTLA